MEREEPWTSRCSMWEAEARAPGAGKVYKLGVLVNEGASWRQ